MLSSYGRVAKVEFSTEVEVSRNGYKNMEVSIEFGSVENSTFLSEVRFLGQNLVRISLKSQSEFGILFGILG